MKKIFLVIFGVLLLVGCGNMESTPSKKVEDFLSKYQNLDNDVITQLDVTIDSDNDMNHDQKKEYRTLLERQYQNLSYKIIDEAQEDDTAEVKVEIEVFDYKTTNEQSKKYYNEHEDEFKDKDDTSKDNDMNSNSKYTEYKLKKLKDTKDKTTYVINFYLTKEKGEWKMNDITNEDILKLHGLY